MVVVPLNFPNERRSAIMLCHHFLARLIVCNLGRLSVKHRHHTDDILPGSMAPKMKTMARNSISRMVVRQFRRVALAGTIVACVLYLCMIWNVSTWAAYNDGTTAKRLSDHDNPNDVRRIPLHARNDTPGIGWIYEPVRLSAFWHLKDRRFMRGQIYPRLQRFHRVLDVGARGYNQECKGLINSTTTEYYQVEPFPPDVMDNDGLLHCKVQEIPQLYPHYASFFDAVLDFGVFGWGGTHQFNTTKELEDDIHAYMNSIMFLLQPKGLWILKVDQHKWVPDEDKVFDKFILPHFDMGNFDEYISGMRVKKFRFYFFYRKEEVSNSSSVMPGGVIGATNVDDAEANVPNQEHVLLLGTKNPVEQIETVQVTNAIPHQGVTTFTETTQK